MKKLFFVISILFAFMLTACTSKQIVYNNYVLEVGEIVRLETRIDSEFASSDDSIIQVDGDGVLKALSVGKASVVISNDTIEEKINVEVIDIYSVTDNHEDYFSDGLHPNFEGNKIIAKEIAKTIKK